MTSLCFGLHLLENVGIIDATDAPVKRCSKPPNYELNVYEIAAADSHGQHTVTIG